MYSDQTYLSSAPVCHGLTATIIFFFKLYVRKEENNEKMDGAAFLTHVVSDMQHSEVVNYICTSTLL